MDQINEHVGLFVPYVAQVGYQELAVFFSQARVIDSRTESLSFNEGTEHEVLLTGIHPIESDTSCKKYKAVFKRFLIYQVIEESCIEWDESEVFEGKFVRTFTKSRFLDHIDSHTNIDWYKVVPEMSYKHYQIGGLDFIVDVVAHEPPVIEEIEEFPGQ